MGGVGSRRVGGDGVGRRCWQGDGGEATIGRRGASAVVLAARSSAALGPARAAEGGELTGGVMYKKTHFIIEDGSPVFLSSHGPAHGYRHRPAVYARRDSLAHVLSGASMYFRV